LRHGVSRSDTKGSNKGHTADTLNRARIELADLPSPPELGPPGHRFRPARPENPIYFNGLSGTVGPSSRTRRPI